MNAVPYNVRELFDQHIAWAALGLSLTLLAVVAAPWWVAWLWRFNHWKSLLTSLVATLLFGSVTFWALYLVVPTESIDDLVGTPVIQIGPQLERWLRFLGLFLGFCWSQALGIRCLLADRPLGARDLVTLAVAALGIGLSYLVVVQWACTDNLTELLPRDGKSIAVVALPCWLAVVGAISALLFAPLKHWTQSIHRLASICAAVVISWVLVNTATAAAVSKYGKTFSALQFLFSPDRSEYLSSAEILPRFVVAHLMLILVLGAGRFLLVGRGRAASGQRRTSAA